MTPEQLETRQSRQLALTDLRDWCMDRLSTLSLDNRHDDARALTSEHLEALEMVDSTRTLWMLIEHSK